MPAPNLLIAAAVAASLILLVASRYSSPIYVAGWDQPLSVKLGPL